MEQTVESIFPEKEVVYAEFWTRFAASFIDGLILMVPVFILRYSGPFGSLIAIIVCWLYYALQESGLKQATVGKKAMRIKVTDLNGQRITFGQATGRFFGKYVSMLILLIGYLMMLWDSKKQALHDKMAGTLVVRTDV